MVTGCGKNLENEWAIMYINRSGKTDNDFPHFRKDFFFLDDKFCGVSDACDREEPDPCVRLCQVCQRKQGFLW